MRALLDTGNVLTDPVTGEPVCILDPDSARGMFESAEQMQGFRYNPLPVRGRREYYESFQG